MIKIDMDLFWIDCGATTLDCIQADLEYDGLARMSVSRNFGGLLTMTGFISQMFGEHLYY